MIVLDAKSMMNAEAKARSAANLKNGVSPLDPRVVSQTTSGKTREALAAQSGISPSIIGRADRVMKADPALAEQVSRPQQAKNRQLELDAAEIRIRAERRIGELMQAQKETVGFNVGVAGSPIKGARVDEKPTLEEAGIDKNLAHRARKAAALSYQGARGFSINPRQASSPGSRYWTSVAHVVFRQLFIDNRQPRGVDYFHDRQRDQNVR